MTASLPLRKPELELRFEERIDILFRELELAVRWNRPSILLAIYASEIVRADAEAALSERLRELGQTVTHYRVTGEENADIPLHLSQHPDKAQTVFFVSGLQWGGGSDGQGAYRALNIRREYFVDYRVRAVFWLTEKEAIALPAHAPDFWAFRHRVVEFVEPPEPGRIVPAARVLAWRDLDMYTLREDTDAKIALREALLADLPGGDETLAARADLLYTLAGLYWAKREYEKSVELWQQALRLAERLENVLLQAWCYNGLGNVYRALGRYEDAQAVYRRAIELDPKYVTPHNGLGNVYRDLSRYEDALAAYRRAIELDPKFAFPHNGLGNVYRALGRYEDALIAYRRAIDLDPQYVAPHNGLGNVYADLGRYEDALAAYRRAIELDPKYAYPHNGLGNVYRDLGSYEDALAAYRRAIDLDPKEAAPHNGLGNVYADLGRNEDALAAYRRAIELDPKFAHPHNGLGTVYHRQCRYDDALAAYRRAIELDPKEAAPHKGLGNVYADLGRTEDAIAAYQRAIELDPKYAHPHNDLGLIYYAQGRYEDALAAYRRAIELNPKYAAPLVGIAGASRHLGDMAQAARYVEMARALLPDEYHLACLESISGNIDAAIEHLRKALEAKPDQRDWARRDPDFDFIRDDPRFKALVSANEQRINE